MRYVSERASAMIDRVLAAETEDFVQLVIAAGMSPESDFRHGLLRGVDFGNAVLRGFDFSGTRFVDCRFKGSSIVGARFDDASFDASELSDAGDYAEWIHTDDPIASSPDRDGRATGSIPGGDGERAAISASGERSGDGPLEALSARQQGSIYVRAICEMADPGVVRDILGVSDIHGFLIDVSRSIEEAIHPMRVVVQDTQIVLTYGTETVEGAIAGLESARRQVTSEINMQAPRIKFDLRVGAAAMQIVSVDGARVHQEAHKALQQALIAGPVVMHDLTLEQDDHRRGALSDALLEGIATDQFSLVYQPVMHAREQRISSVEALMRWHHPHFGSIPPHDIIAAAEGSGASAALALWAADKLIEDQKALASSGHDVILTLNLEDELLHDEAFVRDLCAMWADRGGGSGIGVEIGETSVVRNPDTALRNLHAIADCGIRISIDNYGAGLSSLAYLKQIPAAELKIDRLFITQLTSSNRDPLIVRSMIDLAHALDMTVTATGVETHTALALLITMGCDQVQGFLLFRPMGLQQLMEHLRRPRLPSSTIDAVAGHPPSFWPEQFFPSDEKLLLLAEKRSRARPSAKPDD